MNTLIVLLRNVVRLDADQAIIVFATRTHGTWTSPVYQYKAAPIIRFRDTNGNTKWGAVSLTSAGSGNLLDDAGHYTSSGAPVPDSFGSDVQEAIRIAQELSTL